MSLKAKLASTIAAVCMVICLLSVGIFAATTAKISLSGSVSFVAQDVDVSVAATVSGAAVNTWKESGVITPAATEGATVLPWEVDELQFVKNGDDLNDIVISLEITNNGSKSVSVTAADDTAKANGEGIEVSYDAKLTIAATETKVYKITISAPNGSGDSVTANWAAIVTLTTAAA